MDTRIKSFDFYVESENNDTTDWGVLWLCGARVLYDRLSHSVCVQNLLTEKIDERIWSSQIHAEQ